MEGDIGTQRAVKLVRSTILIPIRLCEMFVLEGYVHYLYLQIIYEISTIKSLGVKIRGKDCK